MALGRILLVDDEQNARTALKTLLAEEGYTVAEAGDGEEGLAVMGSFAPDVVLADVRMPKMDGLTFRRAMLDDPKLRDIPTILLTASEDYRRRADGLGMTFLRKPINFAEIQKAIEDHLRSEAVAV